MKRKLDYLAVFNKQIFFCLLVLFSVKGFAQAPDTTRPVQKLFTYVEYQNFFGVNGGLRIPRDTFHLKQSDSGAIAYKGGKLWLWNGKYFKDAITGSLALVATTGNYNDLINKPAVVSIAGKLNISDTAAMLNNYQAATAIRVKYSDTVAMLAAYQSGLVNRATSTQLNNAQALDVKYTDTSSMLTNYRNSLNGKINVSDTSNMLLAYRNAVNARLKVADTAAMFAAHPGGNFDTTSKFTAYQNAINARVKYTDTAAMHTAYQNALNVRVRFTDTAAMLATYQSAVNARLKISDTAAMFAAHPGGSFDTTSKFTAYQNAINARVKYSDTSAMLSAYRTADGLRVKYTDTTSMLAAYSIADGLRVKYSDTASMLTAYQNALNTKAATAAVVKYTDTATMLNNYQIALNARTAAIALKMSYTDTASMLAAYQTALNNRITSASLANVAYTNTSNAFTPSQTFSGGTYYGPANSSGVFLVQSSGNFFAYRGDVSSFAGFTAESFSPIGPASQIGVYRRDNNVQAGAIYSASGNIDFYHNGLGGNILSLKTSGIQFPAYGAGFAKFDGSGNISSSAIAQSDVTGLTSSLAGKADLSGGNTFAAPNTYSGLTTGQQTDSFLVTNGGAMKRILHVLSTGLTNTSGTITNNLSTGIASQQVLIGSTATNTGLTIKATSGVGTTNADIIFQTGNNGATEAMRIVNAGTISMPLGASIGTTTTNINVNSVSGIGESATASYLTSGSSVMAYRVAFRGSAASTLSANRSYYGLVVGDQGYTEATSGVHPDAGSMLIKGSVSTNGTATTTDWSTLKVEGVLSGITPTGFNDAFRVKFGTSRFEGAMAFRRSTVADAAYSLPDSVYLVAYTSLTATRAVTLPTASSVSGKHFIIKDESGSAASFPITIVGTVNGVSNPTAINTSYGSYSFYSNGTAFFSEFVPSNKVPYVDVTGTSATASVNTKYKANNVALVTITLPTDALSQIGDQVLIRGYNTGLWKLAQPEASTVIHGSSNTTTGTTGYIQAQSRYDCVTVEKVATNEWLIINTRGTLTIF